MRCGSLFSGIGGLDMAVCEFFDAELAWVCEVEKGPSQVLARHFDVPNLGDITKADWNEVESVDILCGGFPCQDISNAGGRAGIREGTRSGLWFEFARAIRSLRPRYVVVENVSNLLAIDNGRGFGIVLGDLAEAGFDAEWCSVRASDVGAPHRRERIFLLAAHPDLDGRLGWGSQPAQVPGLGERAGLHAGPAGSLSPAESSSVGARVEEHRSGGREGQRPDPREPEVLRQEHGSSGSEGIAAGRSDAPDARHHARSPELGEQQEMGSSRTRERRESTVSNTDRGRREQRNQEERGLPEPHSNSWGAYGPAIERWELVTGRTAPDPLDGQGRLAVPFVEWLMGFPAEWTGDLTRTVALKALGNAVVPSQAYYALNRLAA